MDSAEKARPKQPLLQQTDSRKLLPKSTQQSGGKLSDQQPTRKKPPAPKQSIRTSEPQHSTPKLLMVGEPLSKSPADDSRTSWQALPTEVALKPTLAAAVLTVAAGDSHCLLLTSDGSALSRSGDGEDEEFAPVPGLAKLLATSSRVTQLEAGGRHSLALTSEGQVLAWGSNSCGQLGPRADDGSGGGGSLRVGPVTPLMGHRAVLVAAGGGHSLVLTADHQVFAFGDNSHGQLGRGHCQTGSGLAPVRRLGGLPVRQIACGGRHSFVLSHSAVLLAWGSNDRGQLGCGTEDGNATRPLPVECSALRNRRVRRIACGHDHTAAVTADGGLFTFGAGDLGQLGHGSNSSESLPRQVAELMGSRVVTADCGTSVTYASCQGGRVYAFGTVGPSASVCNKPWPLTLGPGGAGDVDVSAGGGRAFLRVGGPPMAAKSSIPEGLLSLDSCDPDGDWPGCLAIAACPAAYARAFLLPDIEHENPRPGWHGLDLDAAAEFLQKRLGAAAVSNPERRQELLAAQTELLTDLTEREEAHLADAECLRLLLLLPLSPEFESPGPLQPALAELVLRLPRPLMTVLLSWIMELRLRHFARLVRCLIRAAQHLLASSDCDANGEANEAAKVDADEQRIRRLRPCLDFLKRLHALNSDRRDRLPASSFHLAEIRDRVPLEKDYRAWTENRNQFSFLKYPFVFDSHAKMELLKVDARMQMEQAFREAMMFNLFQGFTFGAIFDMRSPFLVLRVARQALIQDAVVSLSSCHPAELKKPLRITFKGEEAVDEGGLTKEFFLLIFRQILDPVYGMFTCFDSNLVWFNHSTLECPENFSLIGTLLGLAIYNSILAAVPFPMALFKKLLRQPVALDDLKELDPTVGNSLQSLLDAETANSVEELELNFEIETKMFDHVQRVPLSASPEDRVTLGNRESYVSAYVDFVLNRSCRDAFDAFQAGFERACGSPVLPLLEPQELQAIINGESGCFDWDQLEQGAIYVNPSPDYQQLIANFWSVFHQDLDEDNKRRFLRFLTGSDRVPVQGMSAVRLRIQVVHCSPRCLPVAHTCYNMLDLPRYPDRETLRQKLLLAIDETEGFSLV
ncbi:hypothetical protein BOX15_Mlig004553g1 [Macrostomum lignano]|uniref:HECT domain-containing protein n=1 Tax=Macrostomum lignano TaxID=282301 RepID=A0A267E395_9PLAT|nr:hypothetical protein BOX15_Mlig004553g1 [Macrostomum lignano]